MDKEMTKLILNSINEGVFTVDENFTITSFNAGAEKIAGFSRKDAVGKPCRAVFHASICQDRCALRETLRTGKEMTDATSAPSKN